MNSTTQQGLQRVVDLLSDNKVDQLATDPLVRLLPPLIKQQLPNPDIPPTPDYNSTASNALRQIQWDIRFCRPPYSDTSIVPQDLQDRLAEAETTYAAEQTRLAEQERQLALSYWQWRLNPPTLGPTTRYDPIYRDTTGRVIPQPKLSTVNRTTPAPISVPRHPTCKLQRDPLKAVADTYNPPKTYRDVFLVTEHETVATDGILLLIHRETPTTSPDLYVAKTGNTYTGTLSNAFQDNWQTLVLDLNHTQHHFTLDAQDLFDALHFAGGCINSPTVILHSGPAGMVLKGHDLMVDTCVKLGDPCDGALFDVHLFTDITKTALKLMSGSVEMYVYHDTVRLDCGPITAIVKTYEEKD